MAETTERAQHLLNRGELRPGYEKVLTPAAVAFIAGLQRKFAPRRHQLLARRAEIQRTRRS